LIRCVSLLALAALAFAQTKPQPQETGDLDGSPALFTVLAALNSLGGYDAELESPSTPPIRKQIRDAIAAKRLTSLDALKKFFDAHRLDNADAELSQYISFALSVGGPPDFEYRVPAAEIPNDVRKLEGLNPLIAQFYREAGIEDLWKRSQPAYGQMIANYHSGVAKAVLEANVYLRNPTSGFRGRRFQIYIDLLGAPNQVQTRSYKDDYFVVVTPSTEPEIAEIRHAYLHYLLDPLALRHFEILSRLKPLAELAIPAPALADAYKDDFLLLATECLIKAVEIRLTSGTANREKLLGQDLREGYVLTSGMVESLATYEKQEQSMRFYFPDLIGTIDLDREDKRLANVQFAQTASVKVKHTLPPPAPVLTGAAKTLSEAEELYSKRDLGQARLKYLRALEQPAENSMHARAYYGLARIAALQRDPELAQKLFQKTIDLSPDKDTLSWARVYLGRLADAAGEREEAEKNYRAVLAIDGAPEPARNAAAKGLSQPFQKK